MKVRVLVEVIEDHRTDGHPVVRRLGQTSVSPRVMKLYEVMGGADLSGFLADDVISGAFRVVQSEAAMQNRAVVDLDKKPAVDSQGKPTGRTKLEEALGLGIIDHMLEKDGAGAGAPTVVRQD